MAGNEAVKGWLAIPGVQRGERTLAEQMMGLEPALTDCPGKTVIDFGCAEGLIGIEFAKAGAIVWGLELQDRFIKTAAAQAQLAGVDARCRFERFDLSGFVELGAAIDWSPSDIVLALAIVHKLRHPGNALRNMAALARERLVLRLPIGSVGVIACKFDAAARCDSREVMPDCGFRLEQQLEGPRGELVQHWTR